MIRPVYCVLSAMRAIRKESLVRRPVFTNPDHLSVWVLILDMLTKLVQSAESFGLDVAHGTFKAIDRVHKWVHLADGIEFESIAGRIEAGYPRTPQQY